MENQKEDGIAIFGQILWKQGAHHNNKTNCLYAFSYITLIPTLALTHTGKAMYKHTHTCKHSH